MVYLQGVVGRSLQHGPEVTVVETAEALREAVAGMAHIEIHAHLQLTALENPKDTILILGVIPETVKSIRVRSTRRTPVLAPCWCDL